MLDEDFNFNLISIFNPKIELEPYQFFFSSDRVRSQILAECYALITYLHLSATDFHHNLDRFTGCSVDARSTTSRTVNHHKYGKENVLAESPPATAAEKKNIFAKSIAGRHALQTSYFPTK